MNQSVTIVHVSRMDTMGGIERLLQAFINEPSPDFRHALLATGKKIHQALRPGNPAIPVRYSRYAHGICLPRSFRQAHWNRTLAGLRPDIVSFWGYPTTDHEQLALLPGTRLIYQEHGSGWDMPVTRDRKDFLYRNDMIICCSTAAVRMLQLRWNYSGTIHVARNPLPPHAVSVHSPLRRIRSDRPLVLGVAGRLVPYKASVTALFVLARVISDGIDCRLRIKGTGPLLRALQHKSRQLGLSDRVNFSGASANIAAFYRNIDVLLLPSLREPFGLVAIEAMASGCPVIASAVDGIPEVVIDGKNGFCITPSLAMEEYIGMVGAEFGGRIPEAVYDPAIDRLRVPMAVDPCAMADRIANLINTPKRYTTMSFAAVRTAREDFSFAAYYNNLKDIFLSLV